MKIRQGFVSNSSSSSFLVDYLHSDTITSMKKESALLSEEQVSKLIDIGFRFDSVSSTDRVRDSKYKTMIPEYTMKVGRHDCKTIDLLHNKLVYFHQINSEDVVEELVKLGVPFKMLYNYETTLHIWKPWKRTLLSFTNFGKAYEMNYIRKEIDPWYDPEGVYFESLEGMLSEETWKWLGTKEISTEKFNGLDWR